MPLASRRKDILQPTSPLHQLQPHTGLWLDRMLDRQQVEGDKLRDNEPHPHTALIRQVCALPEPPIYTEVFNRWRAALGRLVNVPPREAIVRGRMVVGLGAEGVLETAIALHRTYGVPYIPGSALKGLAAAYAHQRLEGDTWRKPILNFPPNDNTPFSAHEIMFGSTRISGYVTFFDALYVPESGWKNASGRPQPLWPDVITVHHPDYYQEHKSGSVLPPPTDWDSPNPVSFVSATGRYLVAITGPPAWVAQAFHILALALDEVGVGAKTSTGYGRLTLEGLEAARQALGASLTAASDTNPTQPQSASQTATQGEPGLDQRQRDALQSFIQRLKVSNAGQLPNLIGQWRDLDTSIKRAAAEEFVARANVVFGKRALDRPWYQDLQTFLAGQDSP